MSSEPALPQHIAIIMDGNGRWAKKRFLPRTVGHVKGAAGVRRIVKACADRDIRYLTLFAFSTENWRRPPEEVSTLMDLFVQYLQKEMADMSSEGVRLRVIGDRSAFPQDLQARIAAAEQATAHNTTLHLTVATVRCNVVLCAVACSAAAMRACKSCGKALRSPMTRRRTPSLLMSAISFCRYWTKRSIRVETSSGGRRQFSVLKANSVR